MRTRIAGHTRRNSEMMTPERNPHAVGCGYEVATTKATIRCSFEKFGACKCDYFPHQ